MKTALNIACLIILCSLVISCEKKESTSTEFLLPIAGSYTSTILVYYRVHDSVTISDPYVHWIQDYFMIDARDTRTISDCIIDFDEIGESQYRLRFSSADSVLPEDIAIKVGSYYIYSHNYDIRAKISLEPNDQFELLEYPSPYGIYNENMFVHCSDVSIDLLRVDSFLGEVYFEIQLISRNLGYSLKIRGNRRL